MEQWRENFKLWQIFGNFSPANAKLFVLSAFFDFDCLVLDRKQSSDYEIKIQ